MEMMMLVLKMLGNELHDCIGSYGTDYFNCLPGSSSEEFDHEEIGGRVF